MPMHPNRGSTSNMCASHSLSGFKSFNSMSAPVQLNHQQEGQGHHHNEPEFLKEVPQERQKGTRQRLSLVCNYCKRRKIKCNKEKPSCENCSKMGLKCQYSSIQWINRNLTTKGALDSRITRSDELASKSKEELIEMVKLLQNGPSSNSHTQTQPRTDSGPLFTNDAPLIKNASDEYTAKDIIVDFFAGYNSVSLKFSSHEDHKPLSPVVIFKKDHYCAFFLCYLYLILSLSAEYINDLMRESWKSQHPDGASKWMLLLDTKNEDRDLREPIKRIINDRSKLYRPSIFPFLTLADNDSNHIHLLFEKFQDVAPERSISDRYLTYFFNYIWPLRPFIDEGSFMKDFRRIVLYDPVTGIPSFRLCQRYDASIISQYLIILRYTSVAVQLMNYQGASDLISPLIAAPVPVEAISTGLLFLGVYKISRKITLQSFQALLYLRYYYRDCPEDSDSLSLAQSQNLMGFLTQAAYQMGLNRDPVNFTQTANDVQASNVRRFLWHSMVEIDVRTTVLSGAFSTMPHESGTDVDIPEMTSMDVLGAAQREEYIKERDLNVYFYEIARLVNDVKQKTSLIKLRRLLRETREYVETHYNMDSLKKASSLSSGSRNSFAISYQNVKTLSKNLILLTVELQIYFSLCRVFESNKSLEIKLFKEFFLKGLATHSRVYDISSAYFKGKLRTYIDPAYNFEIYPLLSSVLVRLFFSNASVILRCYHALEILESGVFHDPKMTVESLNSFIEIHCNLTQLFLQLFKDKIGKNYYFGLRSLASLKFGINAIKTHKFEAMARIVRYIETSEEENFQNSIKLPRKEREKFKKYSQISRSLIDNYGEWMHLKSPTINQEGNIRGTIININSSNLFTDLSPSFIEESIEVLTGSFIYDNELKDILNHSLSSEPRLATRNEVRGQELEDRSTLNSTTSPQDDIELNNHLKHASGDYFDINSAISDNYMLDAEFFEEIITGLPDFTSASSDASSIFGKPYGF